MNALYADTPTTWQSANAARPRAILLLEKPSSGGFPGGLMSPSSTAMAPYAMPQDNKNASAFEDRKTGFT